MTARLVDFSLSMFDKQQAAATWEFTYLRVLQSPALPTPAAERYR